MQVPDTSPVNSLVDAVFVVSVRSFTDRIEHMRAQMARFGIRFEWMFDFDPESIDPAMLERTFAPSDLKVTHQSLVLKHAATWRACVERKLSRVLVFEDDVVLAPDFADAFGRAMQQAARLAPGYLIYLGCGDNRYVQAAAHSATTLVPGGPLSAADAIVFDRLAAQRRLDWMAGHRITRPADWLMREIDQQQGTAHFWLSEPIVEQGSMNGRFASSLDEKRRRRGRLYAWLRYRWSKWRYRNLGGRVIRAERP
ncbi:MAG TPA: glycosyltransferase family 25 protein [Burkholderiaceae bacterium]|jgi:glycosyl transferase family 25|nr:glycosyltransferase family 25 protein [Burkholderiaceae bacterium]